ncbi:MAG: zf-HC2 domain-containing protein [Clostridium sp.]|uniref:zf-HC2 domain-containing protein n=1 Tax=Clostridium sp. TaxID=1506 RepID=UPI003EE66C52
MRKECKIVRELMPMYLQGICDKDVMNYISNHLNGCVECRSTYDILNNEELSERTSLL